jgi:mannose-6-phosphate isomerase-like protein (cupin superfamily)
MIEIQVNPVNSTDFSQHYLGMAAIVPVILCGGTGTRLWPLSRASYPKQYWALAGSGEETLLQQTRLEGLAGLEAPLLICNEDHRFIVAEQMHHHRAEHWILVKGTAVVEKDGHQELLGENQSTYIPLGCRHRLSNPGKIPVELIEVQSGPYLGEDDIVRFEDRYGRSDAKLSISTVLA